MISLPSPKSSFSCLASLSYSSVPWGRARSSRVSPFSIMRDICDWLDQVRTCWVDPETRCSTHKSLVVDVDQGVLRPVHVGDLRFAITAMRDVQRRRTAGNVSQKDTHVHVGGGRRQLLVLLAGEDINGDEVALSRAVLASLGGGHIGNLHGELF